MTLDYLATNWGVKMDKVNHYGQCGVKLIADEKVMLVKPMTYMNLSGSCVKAVVDYYKIDLTDLLIVYDDLDLPLGKVRLRAKGSSGGHNGVRSIINELGTENFNRIKLGIGRPSERQFKIADYVLSGFSASEISQTEEMVKNVANICTEFINVSFADLIRKY